MFKSEYMKTGEATLKKYDIFRLDIRAELWGDIIVDAVKEIKNFSPCIKYNDNTM